MKTLRIADDIHLPIDAITSTFSIFGIRGSGKALALDTRLPTPFGWTTMEEIGIGDWLLDEKGKPCRAVGVTEEQINRPCFRVEFSDGSSIVADSEHEWLTETGLTRASYFNRRTKRIRRGVDTLKFQDRAQCVAWRKPEVITTKGMADSLTWGRRGDLNHSIRACEPFDLEDVSLPIDPYVLGVWLGDGAAANAVITTADHEVLEELISAGYTHRKVQCNGAASAYYVSSAHCRPGVNRHQSLLYKLGKLGLIKNKHIPPQYLRAGIEQRRALLSGLMDTDGTIGKGANSCEFYTTSDQIALGVSDLLASLGYVFRRRIKAGMLNGKRHKDCHIFRFVPDRQIFRIARKGNRIDTGRSQRTRNGIRMVKSVIPIPSVPVKCVQVDSESHLYLAGDTCIPTHNSNVGAVMAEGIIQSGQPVCIIDPTGSWWGLKSSSDGKTPGLPAFVFGGAHQDIPLEPTAGEVMANFVAEKRVPVVLDLKLMRKGEQVRFVRSFCESLYHINREPLMLFIDEVARFGPTRIIGGDIEAAKCLGALEDIVTLGRTNGLGATILAQRPATVSTTLRTQTENLVCLRTIGKHDRDAIKEWVEAKASPEELKQVLDRLASLANGNGVFWSPSFMRTIKWTHFDQRTTFDSGATPKIGQKPIVPKAFAEIDKQRLTKEIQDTIERAKADDPRELRKAVEQLKKELEEAKRSTPQVKPPDSEILRKEFERGARSAKAAFAEEFKRYQNLVRTHTKIRQSAIDHCSERLSSANRELEGIDQPIMPSLDEIITNSTPEAPKFEHKTQYIEVLRIPSPPPRNRENGSSPSSGSASTEQRILNAIAELNAIGVARPPRVQVGFMAGYSNLLSKGIKNAMGALRTRGLIEYPDTESVVLTSDGTAMANHPVRPSTNRELQERVMGMLGGAYAKILQELVEVYPDPIDRKELGRRTGYTNVLSKGFKNAIGRLRTLGFVTYPNTETAAASPLLFPGRN